MENVLYFIYQGLLHTMMSNEQSAWTTTHTHKHRWEKRDEGKKGIV